MFGFDNKKFFVGAWLVDAVGAPFVPHMFSFFSDGIVLTTNPTNVQEAPFDSHPRGINDSLGMGSWKSLKRTQAIGTFEQLNADADSHRPAETLRVSFRLMAINNDFFTGQAVVHLGDEQLPDAVLNGKRRIRINQADLELL